MIGLLNMYFVLLLWFYGQSIYLLKRKKLCSREEKRVSGANGYLQIRLPKSKDPGALPQFLIKPLFFSKLILFAFDQLQLK
jgi:hypothetical protein